MMSNIPLEDFAPRFVPDEYVDEDAHKLAPFFTNLDKSVYVPLIFSPEVIGALCSRTSRAKEDLRPIFLKEYIKPFLEEAQNADEQTYGDELRAFIEFLHEHPIKNIFSNPKARSFYSKWLAQYGDDSIAQMAGMHLVYSGISQVAIKHFEDQRIGIAPIEKSTRYVDYGAKTNGKYQYYTDPTLETLGLKDEYEQAMDNLFDTYTDLVPKLSTKLKEQFPEEKEGVVEKKAFDTLRGLLPTSALSQVAFFGNGQAFEYLYSRSAKHPLGEIRWAAERAYEELNDIAPSFLRRVKSEDDGGAAQQYQEYLGTRRQRMEEAVDTHLADADPGTPQDMTAELVEYDPEGEMKVIAGMLYDAPTNHASWAETLEAARSMSDTDKKATIDAYLAGRSARWQKVGRAFENAYVRFELTMNIGAWRDIHRHRMLTQQRQHFTTKHGYDTPPELIDAGLDAPYRAALEKAEEVHEKIAAQDPDLAQYCVALAHRVRFQQWKNLRECFWEMELRTIPEGHPDYRRIEQQKFELLEQAYPLLTQYMHVNTGEYDFARRGQEEKIQQKLKELEKIKA